MKRLVFIFLVMAILPIARAEDWPSFRGANAAGVAGDKPAPTVWDAEKGLNILWKTPIPGLAHSCPIVWGSKVFVTTAISSGDPKGAFRTGLYGDPDSSNDNSKHTWKVYCLDKITGRVIWEKISSEGVPKVKRHIKSSHANCTPATDGKHVVAFFGSEGLFCYDFNGKVLWKQDLGILDAGWFYDPDYGFEVASSPIIYKNMVIVQCDVQKDSFIAAYDITDGHRIWRTAREELPSWGTPTIYEGKTRVELITNATNAVRGYDPVTGKEIWRLTGNPEVTATTPVAAEGLIIICNSYRPNQPIYAIRAGATGDISLKGDKTSNDFVAWSYQRGGTYMPTPVIYGDYLYTCANHGILSVYKMSTGERQYQQRIADKGGAYSASPIVSAGKIYLTSEDGEIYVVKAGPKYELISSNQMGESLMATPAISDGMIFIRALHTVFCISERPDSNARKGEANR